MSDSKISLHSFKDLLASPSGGQPFEPPFEYFTFSKYVTMRQMCSRLDQKFHPVIATALKISIAIPALFIDLLARTLQAIGNIPIRAMNCGYRMTHQRNGTPQASRTLLEEKPSRDESARPLLAPPTVEEAPAKTKDSTAATATPVIAELVITSPVHKLSLTTVFPKVVDDESAKIFVPEAEDGSEPLSLPPTTLLPEEPAASFNINSYLKYLKAGAVGIAILSSAYVAKKCFEFGLNPFNWFNPAAPSTHQTCICPELKPSTPPAIPACPVPDPAPSPQPCIIDANGVIDPKYLENQTFVDELLKEILQQKAVAQPASEEQTSAWSADNAPMLMGLATAGVFTVGVLGTLYRTGRATNAASSTIPLPAPSTGKGANKETPTPTKPAEHPSRKGDPALIQAMQKHRHRLLGYPDKNEDTDAYSPVIIPSLAPLTRKEATAETPQKSDLPPVPTIIGQAMDVHNRALQARLECLPPPADVGNGEDEDWETDPELNAPTPNGLSYRGRWGNHTLSNRS